MAMTVLQGSPREGKQPFFLFFFFPLLPVAILAVKCMEEHEGVAVVVFSVVCAGLCACACACVWCEVVGGGGECCCSLAVFFFFFKVYSATDFTSAYKQAPRGFAAAPLSFFFF